MKILIIILAIIILPGCSTLSTKDKQEVIVNNKTKTATLYPKTEHLQPCDEFSKINYEKSYFKDIVELRVVDAQTLQACSDKQVALANFILQLIEDDKK